jgi:[ribosomal protein S5]-alanine N-acetyltransferase
MIITKRLLLKPYDDNDEESMVELLTNKIIKETYMIPDFSSREEAVSMFKKLQTYSYSKEHYELGIYKQNQLIGFVNDVHIELTSIEIGYVIHPDFHNKGYATEMLSSVMEDLSKKGFSTIIACAFETSLASIRVMEKCGMKRIEKETDIFYKNRNQHCVYYSKTAI